MGTGTTLPKMSHQLIYTVDNSSCSQQRLLKYIFSHAFKNQLIRYYYFFVAFGVGEEVLRCMELLTGSRSAH